MRDAGRKTPFLCIILLVAFACRAQQQTDGAEISNHVFRGLGISGEPSLFEKCANEGYAAFRVFEYIAMSPVAIFRVESTDGASIVTKSTFNDKGEPGSVTSDLNAEKWRGLVDVFRVSGFWAAEAEDGAWNPDSLKWLIEGCYRGNFHSLMLYPERDDRMQDVVRYMTSLEN